MSTERENRLMNGDLPNVEGLEAGADDEQDEDDATRASGAPSTRSTNALT